MLRFIHAADLHLGSLIHYTGSPGPELEKILLNAPYQAFKRLIDYALELEVDFILLAGDVYDQDSRSVKANNFFNQQCKRLQSKKIPVFLINGNHDPFREEGELLSLPENVLLFPSQELGLEKVVSAEGKLLARVLGQSYQGRADSRKMVQSYLVPEQGVWNIALLHSQLEPHNPNYVPCSLKDLIQKEAIHYWALGHIHRTRVLCQQAKRAIAYPGIPQGRDIGEPGLGGALLVELQEELKLFFLPLSPVVWQKVEVPISDDLLNLSDLLQAMSRQAEQLLNEAPQVPEGLPLAKDNIQDVFQGYLVQWVLTGRGKIHNLLREQGEEAISYLLTALREEYQQQSPFIWSNSLKDNSRQDFPDSKNNPFLTEVQQVIQECLQDQDLQKELKAKLGEIWSENLDHEQEYPYRFHLDEESFQAIISRAEEIIKEEFLSRRG